MSQASLRTLCAAVCAFALLSPASAQDRMPLPPPPLGAGARAPALNTRTINRAAPVSVRRLRGHVVLLDFWATWCPSCRTATPALERLHKRFAPQGLTVVGMNVDQGPSVSQVRPFIHQFGITYPVALLTPANARTAEAYRAYGLPAQFLIDKKGVIRWSRSGYDPHGGYALSLLIQKLLAEQGR